MTLPNLNDDIEREYADPEAEVRRAVNEAFTNGDKTVQPSLRVARAAIAVFVSHGWVLPQFFDAMKARGQK